MISLQSVILISSTHPKKCTALCGLSRPTFRMMRELQLAILLASLACISCLVRRIKWHQLAPGAIARRIPGKLTVDLIIVFNPFYTEKCLARVNMNLNPEMCESERFRYGANAEIRWFAYIWFACSMVINSKALFRRAGKYAYCEA